MSKKRTKQKNKVVNPFKIDKKLLAKQIGEMQYKKVQEHFQIKKLTKKDTGLVTYALCVIDEERKNWKVMAQYTSEKKAQKEYARIVKESIAEEQAELKATKAGK